MRKRTWLAWAIGGAIVLSGCGSSSHKTASSAGASAPASREGPPGELPPGTALAPNAPPALRGVAGRVLRSGDLPGLTPQGPSARGTTAAAWVAEEHLPAAEQAREVSRLQSLGFIAAVRERLAPSNAGPTEAISIVVRFRSARSARKDLAEETAAGTKRGAGAFAVPAIPGARGFGGSSGGTTGYNVAFASGPYYYLVGAGYPTGAPGAPGSAAVILAAQHLYGRVHG
jgi:hypothetical protein